MVDRVPSDVFNREVQSKSVVGGIPIEHEPEQAGVIL